MAKPIPRREVAKGPALKDTEDLRVPQVLGCLRLDQNSVNAGKVSAPYVGVQLVTDQYGLVGCGAQTLKTRFQGKRGGLHGVADGLEPQLARRRHDLVAMPVIGHHAQLKALGMGGLEPGGNRGGNLLGVAWHQGVIAIEQNGAFAVGPQGIKVDAIDRGNVSFGAKNPHVNSKTVDALRRFARSTPRPA